MTTDPGPAMRLAFAIRIGAWFGALFLTAVGALFLLWYFGLPQGGLSGARQRWLAEASALLEYAADHRHEVIRERIAAARGNILYLTESRTLTRALEQDDRGLQASFGVVFERLQRAYPDRYEKLMILNPGDGRIRAAGTPAEQGRLFADPALVARAAQPGMTEWIEELPGPDGATALAIVRQLQAPDADDYPGARLLGILVAVLDSGSLLRDELQDDVTGPASAAIASLYDAGGRLLARTAPDSAGPAKVPAQGLLASGFSGTLVERDAQGRDWLVVYRNLQLGGTQGWTLVYALDRARALAALQRDANRLAVAGLLLTLAALMSISLVARRLTRPLQALAVVAERLGAGELAARARPGRRDSRELTVLAAAFNRMADSIQGTQQTLARLVAERTADLVAAQARTEQALARTAQSEALYRTTFEQAPVGVALTEAATARLYEFNERFVEILGWSRDALAASDWTQLIHPEERQADQDCRTRLNAGEITHYRMNQRYLRPDGAVVWINLTVAAVSVGAGEPPRHLAILEDITQRKRMQAALSASEERHRLALETTSEGLWDADLVTGVEVVNERWFTMLGYAPGELAPTFGIWKAHLHPDDGPQVLRAIDDYLHGRAAGYRSEHRIITKSGEVRWHRSLGRVVAWNADGEPLRMIGTHADITDQVQAVARIKEAMEWLQLATQAADIGIWNWDIATGKLEWDERLCTWYEVPAETRSSGLYYDFWKSRVHPHDRERAEAKLAAAVRAGAPNDDEFRIVLPGGRIRCIHSAWVIEQDAEGKPLRVLGVNRDITAQRAQEADLRAAKQAAEAANLAKSAFLAHMSHEIRTPLNTVLGLTQVLERLSPAPDQQAMLAQIHTAGVSLLGIINDILDLSKIEAGQMHIEEHPFALAPLLARLQSTQAVAAQRKGLALRMAPPPAITGRLLGDPLRLEQVLTNLIGNAIKFTDRGEIGVRIEPLDLSDETARLRFAVSDTGIGIAPESLANLFTPFTQADNSITRRFGGTGLGLSICKRFVELLGGRIGVASRLGEGSTFWFELPLRRLPQGEALPPPAAAPTAPRGARLAGRHFLVADDSHINQEVLARLLALEGARSTLAGDGLEVLERLRALPQTIDAVLMDVQMPVMDGLNATRAIRGELHLTQVPIIAVTAGVMQDEQARARAAGVDDVLPKPVDLERLVAVLTRWMRPGAPTAGLPLPTGEGGVPAAADLPVIPGIDPARLALLARGDGGHFLKLLRGFVAEVAGLPGRLQADLDEGAPAAAADRLHGLRGAAANLGALDLAADARRLEDGIRADPAAVADDLARFTTGLAALLSAAAPWLAKPAPPQVPATGAEVPDAAKFAALRAALLAHRPRPARRLFAELASGLAKVYGAGAVRTMSAAMDELRFDEVLRVLEGGES